MSEGEGYRRQYIGREKERRMSTKEVINFQYVECMKLTSETTVYVRFVSGAAQTIEFSEPTRPASMILAFENSCNQQSHYGGYVVNIGEDGKARC